MYKQERSVIFLKIRHIPIVDANGEIAGLVTQSDLVRTQLQMLEKQKAMVEHTVAARIQELMRANKDIELFSLEDTMLCIGSRRTMEVDLEYTHELAKRYNRSYSVVLFDLDHFKQYNDHYGHLEGDKLLKRVAEYLKMAIRTPDRIYRYGGEEFLLLLPETALEQPPIAERLVTGLVDLAIPHCKSPYEVVTISGGIGLENGQKNEKDSWMDVLSEAESGLYLAKQNGRNQIAIDQVWQSR